MILNHKPDQLSTMESRWVPEPEPEEYVVPRWKKWTAGSQKSGQMVHNISTLPRFPWNKGSHFPYYSPPFGGPGRVRSRFHLTRKMEVDERWFSPFNWAILSFHIRSISVFWGRNHLVSFKHPKSNLLHITHDFKGQLWAENPLPFMALPLQFLGESDLPPNDFT